MRSTPGASDDYSAGELAGLTEQLA
jgi:hypothetical protein